VNGRIALFAVAAGAMLMSWCASFVLWRAAERGEDVMPLPVRDFSALEVITVGTGSAFENPERRGPSVALGDGEAVWLVDAGRGVAEGLRAAAIPVSQPGTVFLTSLLPVNTVGLDDLLMLGFRQGRTQPLRLIGPPGTQAFASALEQAYEGAANALAQQLALPPEGARIEALEVDETFSETIGGWTARASVLQGGPTPALVWGFEGTGRKLVVAGSSWDPEEVIRFSQGADLLVHEAVFIPTEEDARNAELELDIAKLDRERPLHVSINDIGAIAQEAGVDELALIRLRPPPLYNFRFKSIVSRNYDGTVSIPEDGESIWP